MTQSFSDLLLYIYPLKDKINFCSCSNCITSVLLRCIWFGRTRTGRCAP